MIITPELRLLATLVPAIAVRAPGLGQKVRTFLDCVQDLCDESDYCGSCFKGSESLDEAWSSAWKSAEASESNKTAELGNKEAWTVCGRRVMGIYYKKVWRYSIENVPQD